MKRKINPFLAMVAMMAAFDAPPDRPQEVETKELKRHRNGKSIVEQNRERRAEWIDKQKAKRNRKGDPQ